MDSPSSLQYTNPPRSRASSYLTSPHSSTADHRGAIHKRSYNDRPRSISSLQADRLYHQATDQADHIADLNGSNPLSNGDIRWITPQHSPQLTGFTTAPPIDPYPLWTAPTPPQSDSGLPTVSFDANEEPATCAPSDFFRQPTAEMRYDFIKLLCFVILQLTRLQLSRILASVTIRQLAVRFGR